MAELRSGLAKIAIGNAPATVRQIFYLAVSAGLVGKTESEYKATVCRLLSEARLNGELGWYTIVDHTRTYYRPDTHNGLRDAIGDIANFYRRDMWKDAPVNVEIWCEKQTLLGVLRPVTSTFDVGLYPTRGYPSLSFLYSCAEDIEASHKPTYIYYLGDYDASGRHIAVNVESRLREFAPHSDIRFERLAVNREQISAWGLETRPPKKGDTRHHAYGDDFAAEVEAIPPDRLRQMVTEAIENHVDAERWTNLRAVEDSEKQILRLLPRGNFEDMEVKVDPKYSVGGVITLPYGQRDADF